MKNVKARVKLPRCTWLSEPSLVVYVITGFIQESLSKIQGLFKTSQDYFTVFKD